MTPANLVRSTLPLNLFLLGTVLGCFWGGFFVGAITQAEVSQKTTLECTNQGFVVYMESDLVLDSVGKFGNPL